MKEQPVRWQGSITIFLSLMLVVVLGFTGACLEYARAQAVSCQVRLAADSAAESIFAGYHDPMYGTYGLLGRLIPAGNMGELEKETLRYVEAYGGRSETMGSTTIAGFSAGEADWTEVAYLTDRNGKVFTTMAAEAMKTEAADLILSRWKERLGLSDPETGGAMAGSAGKETWSRRDLMQEYDGWNEAVKKAQQEAADRAAEAASRGYESGEKPKAAGPGAEGTKILNLIETMKTLLGNGPVSLVIPRGKTISAGVLPESGLPSNLSAGMKSRSVSGNAFSGGNTLLVHEYYMRRMDCFTSDADKSIAYELEYLVAGKKTDKANLEAVLTRILWMRIALNLTYLNKSPVKKAEAREAAALAVGWTGVLPLIETTTQLLLSAWAAGEAIVDVRTLLSGEKVPLKKTDDTWNLSLAGLAKAGKSTLQGTTSGTEDGLSYVDHLRIILYTMGEQKLAYRAMDVIQWNLRRIDGDLRMENCMVAGKLKVTATSRPIFDVLYRIGGWGGGTSGTTIYKESSFIYK